MATHDVNRGLLWGQLLTGIEGARSQLGLASRGMHLLSDGDKAVLRQASDLLAAVELRAWAAQISDGKGAPKKRRR
jgi:hypothetical protein